MLSEFSSLLPLWILALLFLTAILAGFVDTLAGGGGMLTIPAVLLTGLPTDVALATNKLQACFGTLSATWYFVRRGQINFRKIWYGLIFCLVGAALGATTIQILPQKWLQMVLPVLLIMVALIFICMPKFGEVTQEARWSFPLFACCVAFPLGFYDGFMGPGTGSFFLLSLITLRGRTLWDATIEAKAYNAATNIASLLIFLLSGKIIWIVGLAMGAGQLLGARLAAGLVISKGNALIRPVIIMMSVIMSSVLAYRYWF